MMMLRFEVCFTGPSVKVISGTASWKRVNNIVIPILVGDRETMSLFYFWAAFLLVVFITTYYEKTSLYVVDL